MIKSSALALLLFSAGAQAGIGPDSGWGDLYQNRFYEPETPVIPFYVRASTGADARLFLKKAHDVSVFQGRDGKQYFYGGQARICSRYSVTGSVSDSRRECLSYEEVALVRERTTEFRYCTFRSDDDCQSYAISEDEYRLEYRVPVMYRTSESDSFTPSRVAFYKPLKIGACDDCSERLGY
ncbi:hypothetical protein GCM10011348_34370 [Marinobacterium nitratireducens]|uniref:Uncharacterized protein n=1 Tax=Marinobacterium nitratireducens TaxID=518897 RepID=A0A917ZN79_9GAMM|nr:hypothetical protein [Marinobacterium nitratireducens]GGO85556.1 hypothetical protein GCM10011348_34370 [Marinobacterium nitratireducens]